MKQILILIMTLLFSNSLRANVALAPSFIKSFNQGSRADIINFLTQNMSDSRIETYGLDSHVGVFLNAQNTHGYLEVVEYLPSENNNENVRVISNNSQLSYILSISKEQSAPHKINYFTLQDDITKNREIEPISFVQLTRELSKFLELLNDKEAFSGVVLIAKGRKVMFQKPIGLANKQWEINNTLDTKFSLGSMNKMFTAISTLQLIEQGKLKFEDKLIQFVDKDWLPEGNVDAITVRHLLTHTSGLGNFFNDEFNDSNKEAYRDWEAYKPLISKTPLLFPPGTRNRYSNSGMLMLGLVIEQVSGTTYYDYVQKNIYNKAGMQHSGSFELDSNTPNLATGYLKRIHSDDWVNSIYTRAIKGSAAGGGFSTVGDLHNFSTALTTFKLLGKELTEQATSEKTKYSSAFWYGYGFSISGELNDRVVGHGGAYLGLDARLDIHLDTGITVVILANQSDVVAPVRRKINELLERLY